MYQCMHVDMCLNLNKLVRALAKNLDKLAACESKQI